MSIIQRRLTRYRCHRDKKHEQCFFGFFCFFFSSQCTNASSRCSCVHSQCFSGIKQRKQKPQQQQKNKNANGQGPLEWTFYLHRGSESATLNNRISTAAQNVKPNIGSTGLWTLPILSGHHRGGWHKGYIKLFAICNLTAQCHQILHTRSLTHGYL